MNSNDIEILVEVSFMLVGGYVVFSQVFKHNLKQARQLRIQQLKTAYEKLSPDDPQYSAAYLEYLDAVKKYESKDGAS